MFSLIAERIYNDLKSESKKRMNLPEYYTYLTIDQMNFVNEIIDGNLEESKKDNLKRIKRRMESIADELESEIENLNEEINE